LSFNFPFGSITAGQSFQSPLIFTFLRTLTRFFEAKRSYATGMGVILHSSQVRANARARMQGGIDTKWTPNGLKDRHQDGHQAGK
jgi:hypothetical protein